MFSICRLDGLKEGPIAVGSFGSSDNNWLQVASEAVGEKITSLNASGKEMSFSLMLITQDKATLIERKIAEFESYCSQPDADQEKVSVYLSQIQTLRDQLTDIIDVKASQAKENVRRKHNYVPFIINILREMGLRKL